MIKQIRESVNHKYDIRTRYIIDIPQYESIRFDNYDDCFKFYCDLVNNGSIKEVLGW